MTPLLVLLLLASKVWSMIENNAPRNESSCIPDGQQLQLHCIIHNPRDTFTNLSVRWFRSSDMSAPAEDIADIQDTDYIFFTYFQTMTSLQRNCTQGRLYADTFTLGINNFNTNKDGYYWCNILINDSFLEPSQRARFYAIEGTSCIRQDPYFRSVPDEAQCVSVTTSPDDHTHTATMSTISSDKRTNAITTTTSSDHTINAVTTAMSTITLDDHTQDAVATMMPTTSLETNAETTTSTTSLDDHTNAEIATMSATSHVDVVKTTVSMSDTTSTTILTTLPSVMNIEPIPFYAVGILAVLVLGVGAPALLILLFYVHKSQKEKNLQNRVIAQIHREIDAIQASNQEILATLTDESEAITVGNNQAYYTRMSDMTLGNTCTTTTAVVDKHWHHTSDTIACYDQIAVLHEQPQYNTWQYGSNTSINKRDPRFDADLCISSTEYYDDVVTINEDYPHIYTDMAANEVKPRDYEVVYQSPEFTQEKGTTSEYAHIHEGKYVNDDIEISHMQNPHTYVNKTEKTGQASTQRYDYEPVYHKPNATQDENSTRKHANFDDGKYTGTVSKVKEKAQPGKDEDESTSNEKLQTMHNAFKSSLEEASCIDVNAYLELQSHKEDTAVYFTVQEYSDRVVLECMDGEMVNDQRKMKDPGVEIYEVFDDVKYA